MVFNNIIAIDPMTDELGINKLIIALYVIIHFEHMLCFFYQPVLPYRAFVRSFWTANERIVRLLLKTQIICINIIVVVVVVIVILVNLEIMKVFTSLYKESCKEIRNRDSQIDTKIYQFIFWYYQIS